MSNWKQYATKLYAKKNIQNHKNIFIDCLALLDTYASSHFITQALAKKSKLPLQKSVCLIGAIDNLTTLAEGVIECNIYANDLLFIEKLPFLMVPQVTGEVPSFVFSRNKINNSRVRNIG